MLQAKKKSKILESGKKEYKCEKCGRNYTTLNYLIGHQERRVNCNISGYLQCHYCVYKSKFKESLCSHIRLIHSENSVIRGPYSNGKYKCNICGKGYNLLRSFSRHKKECGKPPRFICDHCEYKTHRKNSLLGHIARVHFE